VSVGQWIIAALGIAMLGVFALYALAMVLYAMQEIVNAAHLALSRYVFKEYRVCTEDTVASFNWHQQTHAKHYFKHFKLSPGESVVLSQHLHGNKLRIIDTRYRPS